MMRRALVFGLLAAGGVAAWTLVEFALGFHTTRLEVGRYTGFVGLLFPVLAVVLALRSARRARGSLGFGQGLLEGLAVTAMFAVLGGVFLWLYYAVVNPGFFADMAARGEPVSLAGQLVVAVTSSLVLGLVVSLVAAALLRRRPEAG
jgi:hypothetical protein